MQRSFLFFACWSFLFSSCEKNGYSATIVVNETNNTAAVSKFSGEFVTGPAGTIAGKEVIHRNTTAFEVKQAVFNSGDQGYGVSEMPGLMDYKFITIHYVAYHCLLR